jgi:hypothetical protein
MIWALVGSRSLMAALALFGAAAFYEAWKVHQRQIGEQEIIQSAEQAGEKANEKNEAVRTAADAPGALQRLRADPKTCPDCKR